MIEVEKKSEDSYKIKDSNGSVMGHYFIRENNEVMTYISSSYGALTTFQLIELTNQANIIDYEINAKENKKQ